MDRAKGARVHGPVPARGLPDGPRARHGCTGAAVRGDGAPRAASHGRSLRLAVGGVQLHAGLGSLGLRHLRIFDGRAVVTISV